MSKNNRTGGNTQNIDIGPKEEKPKKPKPHAQITLTVRDDGTIAGDYWVWQEDALGRRKKWTVGGEEMFKFMHKTLPNQIKTLACVCNFQIVAAGLPEELQGPHVTMRGGKLALVDVNPKTGAISPSQLPVPDLDGTTEPPVPGMGVKLANEHERQTGEALGLPPGAG
jgi:hypothetical protein